MVWIMSWIMDMGRAPSKGLFRRKKKKEKEKKRKDPKQFQIDEHVLLPPGSMSYLLLALIRGLRLSVLCE